MAILDCERLSAAGCCGALFRRWISFFILLLLSVLLLSGCDEAEDLPSRQPAEVIDAAAGDYSISFTEGDCPFFFDADVDAETLAAITCGYMQVPQDRREPDGLQIEIAVAMISSLSDEPLADPILYLEGGPGGGALISSESWLESPLRQERQVILFDQRGTSYSWPNLGCPEIDEASLSSRDGDLFWDALTECRDRLIDLGVDLADYHSAASAQDVADLRRVLGVESWNLLGISYGTRLALTIMRDLPDGVRSVVLDSVYPPNVDAYAEQAITFGGAINLLLDGCAEDPDCDDAFPDLRQTFYDLLLELDADPLYFEADEIDSEEDVEVDAYTFVSVITDSLYDTDLIPLLPQLIANTYDGDYDLLLWDFLLTEDEDYSRQRPDNADPVDEASLYDAQGMFYSVECFEEAPFADLDNVYALAETLDPTLAQLMIEDVLDFFDACAIWLDEQAPALESDPVYSELPVLILAGEYDPVTPPSWARLAAETLPNHIYVELPRGGHALTDIDKCISEITLAFLADPTQEPDTVCIVDAVRPFVTD
ncbi:MAG: alpha/beta fold hydrolase [Caldilineaceae bacterium]|nr:alpha/beta fold hydrolase [Caldilineaceae bacterium]